MKTGMDGVERIGRERQRQIHAEGWTAKHDDAHDQGQLARAAATYAMGTCEIYVGTVDGPSRDFPTPVIRAPERVWPFDLRWDKRHKHSRIRQLEIAGALIAAEIDRLLRGGHK